MAEFQFAPGVPSPYDASKGIVRAAAHCYLLILMGTKENQSYFDAFCTQLCLGSALVEYYGVYCSFRGRVSKELSFLTEKISVSIVWFIILTMMNTKLPDSFENNVMRWIFSASFLLSAMYSTCVHVCEKRSNINDLFLADYDPIISLQHAYLILRFFDEKESTFQTLGIFLCLISAFMKFNGFFRFFHATDKVSKKLSVAMHIFFCVNGWLAALILMHIKLHDFFANIAFGICASCFILSALYFAYVHIFEKEPFRYFKRETISESPSLQDCNTAQMMFTVRMCVTAFNLLRFIDGEASILRTLGIFFGLSSSLVEFNGLFYSICGPDRVAKKLLHVMQVYSSVNWHIGTMLFMRIMDNTSSRIPKVMFAIMAFGFIFPAIRSLFSTVFEADRFSYFKRLCGIKNNSRDSSILEKSA